MDFTRTQDVSKETRGQIVELFKKWNSARDGRNKPARRSFLINFEDSHERTPHCALAHSDLLVEVAASARSVEGARKASGWLRRR